MQESTISVEGQPRRDLERLGYACFKGTDLAVSADQQRELNSLLLAYDALPQDPYCESGNRYRRHSRYVLLPWLRLLEPRPISHYLQSRELNSMDGGVVRTFERLGEEVEANEFLRELILFDFYNAPFDRTIRTTPVDVGVHAIRYVARPGLPGVSSPDKLHKDGEPFTFVHLMARRGVTGGESVIADNDKRPLVTTTLAECLDTVVVSDKDVYHQVEHLKVAAGESEGHRDVLLIDFTPMRSVTLKAPAPR